MDDLTKLRYLLWLRHGCPVSALYGDDGEMSCGMCLIDFGRLAPDEIEAMFIRDSERRAAQPAGAVEPCRNLATMTADQAVVSMRDSIDGDPEFSACDSQLTFWADAVERTLRALRAELIAAAASVRMARTLGATRCVCGPQCDEDNVDLVYFCQGCGGYRP